MDQFRYPPLGRPSCGYPSPTGRSMSDVVQVFGRRHEEAIHALRRPASEKRQCTKSREVGHWLGSERYGELMLAPISMMSGTPARQHLDVCPREVGRVQ